jgi:hypothetical protein
LQKPTSLKTVGFGFYRGGINPAVNADLLPEDNKLWTVSKNTRRVFSNPENIFGVRNLSIIISSPHPTADSIFIHLKLEEGLNVVATNNNTLANHQTTPLFPYN